MTGLDKLITDTNYEELKKLKLLNTKEHIPTLDEVLKLINNRVLQADDFDKTESGAVVISDDGRKRLLRAWQERKKKELTHPYLREKTTWGMIPYVQSLLLARTIRGDLDGYPPFLWK